MSLFNRVKDENGKKRVPVWYMRQAGRYHDHYQNIRKSNSFYDVCKNPELALKTTMGPIDDFGFDAAILFSDLLFPLEHIGLGLSYDSGKPTLARFLKSIDDVKRINPSVDAKEFYNFQSEACSLIRNKLDKDKNLLGFVGAPFTLFAYSVYGTHMGSLVEAKTGLYDERFKVFCEKIIPGILVEMELQAEGGADTVVIFDTAVGELTLSDFRDHIVPVLKMITKTFKAKFPDKKVIYFSKFTSLNHLRLIEDDNIDVLGVDYRHNIKEVLDTLGNDYMIQGNFDPCWLHLPWETLETKLNLFYKNVQESKISLDRWICGLGHGVLPKTPQDNVRKSVEYIKNNFIY